MLESEQLLSQKEIISVYQPCCYCSQDLECSSFVHQQIQLPLCNDGTSESSFHQPESLELMRTLWEQEFRFLIVQNNCPFKESHLSYNKRCETFHDFENEGQKRPPSRRWSDVHLMISQRNCPWTNHPHTVRLQIVHR